GDLSVVDYCRRFKHMAEDLRDLGQLVSDETLVLNIVRGLNERFQALGLHIRRTTPCLRSCRSGMTCALKRSPWPKPLQQPLSLLSPMAALAAVVAALVAPNHRPNNHNSVPFSRHSNSNNFVVHVAVSGGTKKPRTTPPSVLPQAVVAPPLLV